MTTTGIRNASDNLLFNKEVQYTRVWSDNTASFGGAMAYVNKLKETGSLSDLNEYTDGGSVSTYAVESVAKLVKEGLIQGSSNTINPLGNATRAEIAVLMYRIYNK